MANSSVVGLLKVLLTAETAQFEKALSGADSHVTKLANTMKRDLEPSQKRINMLVRDFLGSKEIGRAKDYAAAVERAGGAAKLTAVDQAKVNRAVTDALAHYKALGEKAPASLLAVANATKHAQIPADKFNATLATMKGVFGAFGVTLGAGALVSFGRSAIAAAGQIVDLSDKTGLSIRAVQLYGAVAKQTGGDLNTYADGIFKLGINLAKNGDDVKAALRNLKLSSQELRAAKPEEQFEAIAAKLQAIGNDGERNRLGALLFGKTWKDLAPGVVQGIDMIKNATTIASDASVRAVDAYSDAVDLAMENLQTKATEFIGKFVIRSQQTRGYQAMLGPLGFLMPEIGGAVGLDVPLAGVDSPSGQNKPKPPPPLVDRGLVRQLNELREGALAWSRQGVDKEIAKWLAQAKQFEKDGLTPTTEAIRKVTLQVDEWLRAGFEVPDMLMRVRDENIELVASIFPVGKGLDGLTLSARNYINEMRKVGDAQKPFSAAVKQFADLVNKSKTMSLFSGGISGIDVAATGSTERDAAAARAKALDVLIQKYRMTADVLAIVGQRATGVFKSIVGLTESAISVASQYTESLKTMGAEAAGAQAAWGIATLGFSIITDGINTAITAAGAFKKELQELTAALEELGATPVALGQPPGLVAPSKRVSLLQPVRDQLKEIEELREKVKTAVGALGQSLQSFGGVVPKSLQPFIAQLLTSTHLTAAMRKELEAMTGAPTWQVMQERAEKLGIALSALGANFSQARISDIALQYVRDLTMFEDQSADMTEVLRGMADELSMVAQEAITSGAALPKTLEPYMKRLAEMGLLLDANGNLIDMGALSFKDIEDEALKQMVSFLEEIRDLLKEIGRISIGAPQVPVTGFGGMVTPRAPRMGFDPGPDWIPPMLPSFAGGTHGAYMDFGPGTPVMLHGQERVSTRGEGSGGTFNIYAIDAPSFETFLKQRGGAEAVVRSLPPVVERWGGAR